MLLSRLVTVVLLRTTTGSGAGQGTAKLGLGIPSSTNLIGVRVFAQAGVADPAATALGLPFTQGLELVVGS